FNTRSAFKMLWKGRQGSSNIEDARGIGGRGLALGGGGCGTLIVIVLAVLFGVDPQRLLNQLPDQQQAPTQTQQGRPGANAGQDDEMKQFISVVLGDTEKVWTEVLPKQAGVRYRTPTLRLFSGSVNSACGQAS